jgi:hypothetical protein
LCLARLRLILKDPFQTQPSYVTPITCINLRPDWMVRGERWDVLAGESRVDYFRKDLGRVASLDDGDVDDADYADNAVEFNAVVLETRCISDRAVHIDLKFYRS